MCGRYAFFSAHEAIARLFGVADSLAVEPRYNIAPTQYVPTVLTDHGGVRRLAMLYWGLVPFWAKERAIGARMINARTETLAEKPAFRAAYRKRRCLVLADGYYEWRASGAAGKQPYFVRAALRAPFAMAGLWESWVEREGGETLDSCTIVTTAAVPHIAPLHDRMPLILPAAAYASWLDPATPAARIAELAATAPSESLEFHPVSKRINSARNEGADLIDAVQERATTSNDAARATVETPRSATPQRDLFDE